MKTFAEVYVTLLGFVNFKLFSSINLCYPPKVASLTSDHTSLAGEDEADLASEYVSALSRPLLKSNVEMDLSEDKADDFEDDNLEKDAEMKSCVGLTFNQTSKLQKLFDGLKFFINREVPRESLVFVIRSLGGQVSWDKNSFVGATYEESDPTITHHIVDREVIAKKYLNRFYVQPQWVVDSINARMLLPVQDYFPGVPLPPHLSPFVQEAEGQYISPDAIRLRQLQSGTAPEEENMDESVNESESEDEEAAQAKAALKKQAKKRQRAEDDEKALDVKTEVKRGKVSRENVDKKNKDQEAEDKRLAVMMIPKKKKRLYDKIMYGKRRNVREAENLATKRAQHDKKTKKAKKTSKAA